jgi:ligand-binding sensor domain-containing protein/signal transduction histidine kinase
MLRCLIAALLPIPAFSSPEEAGHSPWSLRVWRSDDGLPNNQVTGLAQTPDGYLWVATYASPARFDGVRFDPYASKNFAGEPNQKITALQVSRQGGLWMGALHGQIYLVSANGIRAFTAGLPDKQVQTLTEDNDGGLWITFQSGPVCRLKDNEVIEFTTLQGLPAATTPEWYACSVACDTRGRIWWSKSGHFGVFRDGRFETLLHFRPTTTRLAASRSGGIWICCGEQLLKYEADGTLHDHGTYRPRQPGLAPTVLIEDSKGGVWIGTGDNGLYHYDGSTFESVATSDLRITSVAEDRKGNMWVGTLAGGLNRIRPQVVELATVETGLPFAAVQSVTEDRQGDIWATTQNGLLVRQQDGAWSTVSSDAKWPGGRASCVTTDAEGTVWIGTRDRALIRWDGQAFTALRRTQGLAGREIHTLVVGRDGDLWIGQSSPDVVQRLKGGQLKTYQMPAGIRVIRTMTEDSRGDLWLGTSKGMLIRISGDQVIDETERTTGKPLSIRCLRAMPDGSLWIGYADEGVGWLKDGHFYHLNSSSGFPEHNVSQIVPDNHGWLWFGGDRGIFKTRQSDLEDFARGQLTKVHSIRYAQSEGLVSLEASFGDTPGAMRSRDGRLWIPMRTGLAIANPARQRENAEPPPVVLREVRLDDRVIATYGGVFPVVNSVDLGRPGATVVLPPKHLRLEIDFTALNSGAPENVRFRYRLEGLGEDWVDATTQRTALYSRLSAGHYRFQVQACNSDGIWNEQGAVLSLSVTPFLWQTWWFRVGALLAFTSLTAGVVRTISLRRVRERLRRLEQQAALHKERSRIARDLHDEFGTRLTELGLIAELDRQAGDESDREGTDLIENIRALERDLDTIVWAVNPKNDTLDQLVGFICRVSGEFLGRTGIRCRFELPEELPPRPLSPELRHHLFLVVREAVNNIVKHSSASLVKIGVTLHDDRLQFRIENDGGGFSVPDAEAGGRNGLKNMRSRIEELGGTFQVTSAPAVGTKIEIEVSLDLLSTETPSRGSGRSIH